MNYKDKQDILLSFFNKKLFEEGLINESEFLCIERMLAFDDVL